MQQGNWFSDFQAMVEVIPLPSLWIGTWRKSVCWYWRNRLKKNKGSVSYPTDKKSICAGTCCSLEMHCCAITNATDTCKILRHWNKWKYHSFLCLQNLQARWPGLSWQFLLPMACFHTLISSWHCNRQKVGRATLHKTELQANWWHKKFHAETNSKDRFENEAHAILAREGPREIHI